MNINTNISLMQSPMNSFSAKVSESYEQMPVKKPATENEQQLDFANLQINDKILDESMGASQSAIATILGLGTNIDITV